jgi:DsbC/DsbD-like thiol-disulfide interchange protein/cytochrome c biogenesis protein CcdA
VRLVTPYAEAPTGGAIRLGLEFETAPGWHVYWKNAGDAGYPPAVDASPTPALSAVEILWPAPQRYELAGDLVAFGYGGQVIYPLRGRIDATGPYLKLAVDLDYLVCEVDCVPYSYRLSVDQPLAPPAGEPVPDPEVEPRLAAWETRVPRPVEAVTGARTNATLDLLRPEQPTLVVAVEGVASAPGIEPDLFLETHDLFDAERPVLTRDYGALHFRVPLSFRQHPDELPAASDFAWTVTGLVDDAGGALSLSAARTVEARLPGSTEPAAEPSAATPPSLAGLLLLAVLGGLLLHLTPTLLPLLAARLARLGELAEGDSATAARRQALLTAAGCIAGAAALDPLATAAHRVGLPATWGAQLQEPVLLAGLVLGAALLALVLWGFVPKLLRRGASSASTPSTVGSFLLGLVTVFLALAWNLPLVSRPLGAALASGRGTGLAAFLALGVGLALPHLATAALLGAAPGRLPRPSRRWVEALGFVAAGGALWLLYLLSRLVSPEGLAYVQLALLGVAFTAWLAGSARRRRWSVAWTVVLLLLVGAVLWLADGQRRRAGETAGIEADFTLVTTSLQPTGELPRCATDRTG